MPAKNLLLQAVLFPSTIHIVVVTDDHYAILLGALLKSVETNYTGTEPVNVYVVDDGISAGNRQKLTGCIRKDGQLSLHWIPIAEAIPEGVSLPVVPNSYPLNTYIRLLIPYFLPPQVMRVLFMDVDMLVLGDIDELWRTDIGTFPIGAVRDSITKKIGAWEAGGIRNWTELGLDPEAAYFNAGLQLINVPVWREQKLTERIMRCIHDNARYATFGDQYGLNAILAENWFPLPPLWNYMAGGDHAHPQLIHFIHRKPIYRSYSNNPMYQRLFYEYLSHTPWRDAKPITESRRYAKKLANVLQKARHLF